MTKHIICTNLSLCKTESRNWQSITKAMNGDSKYATHTRAIHTYWYLPRAIHTYWYLYNTEIYYNGIWWHYHSPYMRKLNWSLCYANMCFAWTILYSQPTPRTHILISIYAEINGIWWHHHSPYMRKL